MTQKPLSLISLAFLCFTGCAFAQIVTTPLEVVKEVSLPKDVYDIVAVGGPNAGIQCDTNGNVWIPGVRGYSDAVSSIVRFGSKNATLHIDIDKTLRLKNGSIEYFDPLQDGGVVALVRTVAEYNTFDGRPTTPKRYADTFAVAFDPSGSILNITELK